MIKITLGEAKNLIEPMKKISCQELPAKYSWKIFNICEQLEVLANKIEDFRTKLVTKYGDPIYVYNQDEQEITYTQEEYDSLENVPTNIGKRIEVRDKTKMIEFYNELNELLCIEEELNCEKINVSDIMDKLVLSVQEISALKSIFDFECI